MKAFVFKPSNEPVGKFIVERPDEIHTEAAKFVTQNPSMPDYSYIESFGKVWTIVTREPFKVEEGRVHPPARVTTEEDSDALIAVPGDGEEKKASGEERTTASAAARRYRDAYLVAKATVAIGAAVKTIAICLGALIVIVALVAGDKSGSSGQFFIGGLLLGVIVAVPIFILGVLVAAHGQVLKATLDTAVHSSPFLKKDEMARVMSLR